VRALPFKKCYLTTMFLEDGENSTKTAENTEAYSEAAEAK
jgi:hypothetical protein